MHMMQGGFPLPIQMQEPRLRDERSQRGVEVGGAGGKRCVGCPGRKMGCKEENSCLGPAESAHGVNFLQWD